jgi:hypothetical protein
LQQQQQPAEALSPVASASRPVATLSRSDLDVILSCLDPDRQWPERRAIFHHARKLFIELVGEIE